MSNLSNFRPALSIVATPKRRSTILELAQEAERRGFAGLACPSLGGTMGLCVSLAHCTTTIPFWTSIQPIYYSHPVEMGNIASHINEISAGRFRLGLGVSHGPVVKRLGVSAGAPLRDIADYVATMRSNEKFSGSLPPIYLATLRDKMLEMSLSIGDGAIWANASLSAIARQADAARAKKPDFFMSNMIPTVIDNDRKAAEAINRRTMTGYVILPNYRNYWRAAGYAEEMDAIERALESGNRDDLPSLMSDAWLRDCTLGGSPDQVRAGLEQWMSKGVLPIAVMSSTSGGQAKAIAELFEIYG